MSKRDRVRFANSKNELVAKVQHTYHSSQHSEIYEQNGLSRFLAKPYTKLKHIEDVIHDTENVANHIHEIPIIFHMIWLVNNNKPKEVEDQVISVIINNIKKCERVFTHGEYLLWTNNIYAIPNTQKKLEQYVIFKDIEELSYNPLKQELHDAIARNMLAQAGDIARGLVIFEQGGIYLDLDYLIYNEMLLRNMVYSYSLILGREEARSIANGFIAATPKHPVILELINMMKKNLAVPNVITSDIACGVSKLDLPDYIKYPANLFSSVITKTGPIVLNMAFHSKEQDNSNRDTDVTVAHGVIFYYPGYTKESEERKELIAKGYVLGNDRYGGSWITGGYYEDITHYRCTSDNHFDDITKGYVLGSDRYDSSCSNGHYDGINNYQCMVDNHFDDMYNA